MSDSVSTSDLSKTNRREFLKKGSTLAAATALSTLVVPHVFAAEDNTIRLALIGCGGRGGGAVANALATKAGPVKLVAMADLFDTQIKEHLDSLKTEFKEAVDVTPERM